jgi:hypothetical protein
MLIVVSNTQLTYCCTSSITHHRIEIYHDNNETCQRRKREECSGGTWILTQRCSFDGADDQCRVKAAGREREEMAV